MWFQAKPYTLLSPKLTALPNKAIFQIKKLYIRILERKIIWSVMEVLSS